MNLIMVRALPGRFSPFLVNRRGFLPSHLLAPQSAMAAPCWCALAARTRQSARRSSRQCVRTIEH